MPVRLLLGGGLLLVAIGLLTMTAVDASSGWTTLIPGFVLAGAGIGLINPPLASTAVGVVHHTRSGMASGINNTFRQVGIATGIAGLGAVFQHEVTIKTTEALSTTVVGHHVIAATHGQLGPALVSGDVRRYRHAPARPRAAALIHAYRVGFTERLHDDPPDRRADRLRRRDLRPGARPRRTSSHPTTASRRASSPPRPSPPEAMSAPIERVLAEQRRYYRERAGEYEDWWFRRGRYEHGPEADARWFDEVAAVQDALEQFAPRGRVLELACGTGLWTARLAPHAERLTALDASAEVLELARSKVPDPDVEFTQADLFEWEPAGEFDVVFFSFWLSHVPAELMGRFFAKVERALASGGRLFLIDSARSSRASARDHDLAEPGEQLARRRLADGRQYTIVKHWFEAPALQRLLETLGWQASISSSGEFFVYGEASPPGSPSAADGV